MAKGEPNKPKVTKKQQTVRQRAESANEPAKQRRIRPKASHVTTPLKKIRDFGKLEYNVIPLPDNKVGAFLGTRVSLTPNFIREAWAEIRQVTWPNRRESLRLTLAVFIFAVIFAVIVGFLDYGLDKLFRKVILK